MTTEECDHLLRQLLEIGPLTIDQHFNFTIGNYIMSYNQYNFQSALFRALIDFKVNQKVEEFKKEFYE